MSGHGQYGRGNKKYPTIMLEVVASHDLWIWHTSFVLGVRMTISMFISLFDDILDDVTPIALFKVNGAGFEKGYYCADGVYPQ